MYTPHEILTSASNIFLAGKEKSAEKKQKKEEKAVRKQVKKLARKIERSGYAYMDIKQINKFVGHDVLLRFYGDDSMRPIDATSLHNSRLRLLVTEAQHADMLVHYSVKKSDHEVSGIYFRVKNNH